MDNAQQPGEKRRAEYLARLSEVIADPTHRRVVAAYAGDDPVRSMEAELGRILQEILEHED